jgi:hypothetical protein
MTNPTTPAEWDTTVATFPAWVVAEHLGLSVATVRRHCKQGKLEALWLKGTWRISATALAQALHAQHGRYIVPGRTAFFRDLEVDTLQEQALRLELLTSSTSLRATRDHHGRLAFAYVPSAAEWTHHCQRLMELPHFD